MKREFKKGEEIFAWNYLEPDLNGFGIVLEDKVVEEDDEIVYIQVNSSGENQETADRIYKLAPNRICSRCGCVVCIEHNDFTTEQDEEDDHNYPYYCPDHDENLFEFETTEVDDEVYARCFQDSVGRFLPEEEL